MNHSQLNKAIATRLDLPEKTVAAITETCWEIITDELVEGGNVTIQGFGVFEVVGRSGIKGGLSAAKQKRFANFRAGKGLNAALMGENGNR